MGFCVKLVQRQTNISKTKEHKCYSSQVEGESCIYLAKCVCCYSFGMKSQDDCEYFTSLCV